MDLLYERQVNNMSVNGMTYVTMAIVCVIYFGISIYMVRGVKLGIKDICISGIVMAVTVVLENIIIPLPTGASLPFASMAPLMIMAICYDYKVTFIAGWALGILATFMMPGWQPVHWGQVLVEHMICFSCLAYAGIFKSLKKKYVLAGILIASAIKLVSHIMSGVLFFSQNAWDGFGAWWYSIIYNVSQNVPLSIISAIVVLVLPLGTLKKSFGKEKK